ncbi:MAG: tryptophan-rich sensory protein [Patescibacteria group bacterium]|nr:tryptophan-rich sensory protein [Patescibacteria group bacterium]MDD4304153.1 tryptophan-rich sensory protein [Patescibacteria group bacterium]MDD4695184.1 tryptophan-rich sensory protein [Patescibacteria group bacterium]
MLKKIAQFIVSILVCLSAGFIGSLFTTPNIPTWYSTLQKPSFNPPNWLFAPVWTSLFILMGISLYLILQKENNKKAIFIFTIQLILNIAWSFSFFALQNPLYGLINILILLIFIILTITNFYKLNRTSAYLLLPYLFWVSFATILNFYLYKLN